MVISSWRMIPSSPISAPRSPVGIRFRHSWDDPYISVKWPLGRLTGDSIMLADKDKKFLTFKQCFTLYFTYQILSSLSC